MVGEPDTFYRRRLVLKHALMREGVFSFLLHAMGWETANVHLGNLAAVAAIARDLKVAGPLGAYGGRRNGQSDDSRLE